MHIKLKAIREYIGLTETEFSKIINISSYKYKRFEDGSLPVSTEYLIIISVAYDLLIDCFILDKFAAEYILQLNEVKELKTKRNVIKQLEENICNESSCSCAKPNYSVIKNILDNKRQNCSYNFKKIRSELTLDISEMASNLNMSEDSYFAIEQGKIFPSIMQLKSFSKFYGESISRVFEPV